MVDWDAVDAMSRLAGHLHLGFDFQALAPASVFG